VQALALALRQASAALQTLVPGWQEQLQVLPRMLLIQ